MIRLTNYSPSRYLSSFLNPTGAPQLPLDLKSMNPVNGAMHNYASNPDIALQYGPSDPSGAARVPTSSSGPVKDLSAPDKGNGAAGLLGALAPVASGVTQTANTNTASPSKPTASSVTQASNGGITSNLIDSANNTNTGVTASGFSGNEAKAAESTMGTVNAIASDMGADSNNPAAAASSLAGGLATQSAGTSILGDAVGMGGLVLGSNLIKGLTGGASKSNQVASEAAQTMMDKVANNKSSLLQNTNALGSQGAKAAIEAQQATNSQALSADAISSMNALKGTANSLMQNQMSLANNQMRQNQMQTAGLKDTIKNQMAGSATAKLGNVSAIGNQLAQNNAASYGQSAQALSGAGQQAAQMNAQASDVRNQDLASNFERNVKPTLNNWENFQQAATHLASQAMGTAEARDNNAYNALGGTARLMGTRAGAQEETHQYMTTARQKQGVNEALTSGDSRGTSNKTIETSMDIDTGNEAIDVGHGVIKPSDESLAPITAIEKTPGQPGPNGKPLPDERPVPAPLDDNGIPKFDMDSFTKMDINTPNKAPGQITAPDFSKIDPVVMDQTSGGASKRQQFEDVKRTYNKPNLTPNDIGPADIYENQDKPQGISHYLNNLNNSDFPQYIPNTGFSRFMPTWRR